VRDTEWLARRPCVLPNAMRCISGGALDLSREVAQAAESEQAGILASEIDPHPVRVLIRLATPSVDAHASRTRSSSVHGVRAHPDLGARLRGRRRGHLARDGSGTRGSVGADSRDRAWSWWQPRVPGTTISHRRTWSRRRCLPMGPPAAVIVERTSRDRTRTAPRPLALLASHSAFWPGTLDVMGWQVEDTGLGVVFLARDSRGRAGEKSAPT